MGKPIVAGSVVYRCVRLVAMTVKSVVGDKAECQWFEGDTLRQGVFDVGELIEATKE